jgi:hypothetical protein
VKVYVDWRDWWVGVYFGDRGTYICLIPTVVVLFERRNRHGEK